MQENTPNIGNDIQRKESFNNLLILTGTYVITILIWHFVQLIFFMAILDPPGPTNVPGFIALLLASAYLYLSPIALAVGWFLHYRGSYRNALRVSVFPVASFVLMIIAFGLYLVLH